MKLFQPKTNAVSSEELARQAKQLLDTLVDEKELQKEISEMLSSSHPCKRRKTDVPQHRLDNDVVELLKVLLHDPNTDLPTSIIQESIHSVDGFSSVIDAVELDKVDVRQVIRSFTGLTPVQNIGILIEKNCISISDMVKILDDKTFDVIARNIIRSRSALSDRLLNFLVKNHSGKLSRICASLVQDPADDVVNVENLTFPIVQDFLSLILQKPGVALNETYQHVIKLHAQRTLQSEILQVSVFLKPFPVVQILDVIKDTCNICNVNPRYLLVLWYSILKADSPQCLLFLSDMLKESISQQNLHNFILALILTRSLDFIGVQYYPDSYKQYFGNSTNHITSSKAVEFVLDAFIMMVPHEIGHFLKHHIQLPLRGGAKFKDKLDQYVMLAKSRMRDFTEKDIDENVIGEVEKSIMSFKKKNSIPSSILEASIFKKQYYTNHFLPCLLFDKNVSDDVARNELVDALRSAKKIPTSVLSKKDDVIEITPSENINHLIDLLPTSKDTESLKNRIYSVFCCSRDRAALTKLVRTVCLECEFDSVEFLTPFHNLLQISSDFQETIKSLIKESVDSKFMEVLELFDTDTNTAILKHVIQNCKVDLKPMFTSFPVAIEPEFVHLIVLGKLSFADYNYPCAIPDQVWKKLDIHLLCGVSSWWPTDDFAKLHQDIDTIFENVSQHQQPNTICVGLFIACLASEGNLALFTSLLVRVLHLTNFNKLWVYEALAKVLLPLYQSGFDKPISTIGCIFKQFFDVLSIVQPSLLHRSGNYKSIDNLCSVLDSYKIYITTDKFLFKYPVMHTILSAVGKDQSLFAALCKRSVTFVVSCVCYPNILTHFSVVKNNDVIGRIASCSNGPSTAAVVDDSTAVCIGICQYHHSPNLSPTVDNDVTRAAYITAMYHDYANLWISDKLTSKHLHSLAQVTLQQRNIGLTQQYIVHGTAKDSTISTHFDGYKTSRVFPLLYLGSVAEWCSSGNNGVISERDVVTATRKAYQQAQKIVYDRNDVMKSMQQFALSVTHQNKQLVVTAGQTFVRCLVGI